MNLDERLEALTHSVELMAAMHKDNEARMGQYEARMEQYARDTDRRMKRLDRYVQAGMTILFDHNTRLRTLEILLRDDDSEGNGKQDT
jgi:hypothetical protein